MVSGKQGSWRRNRYTATTRKPVSLMFLFRRIAGALDSWSRVGFIFIVIISSGIYDEMRIVGAEFMMLVRWSRDVVRYDLRWVVQEKLRVMMTRRTRQAKD